MALHFYTSKHLIFNELIYVLFFNSWLLHLALSSVGYNIPADIANTLHMNFASQLESVGLWDWAIFVLLHHTDTDW